VADVAVAGAAVGCEVVAAAVAVAVWLAELEQAASQSAAASTTTLTPARRTCVIRIRIADSPNLTEKVPQVT
jgi:hypothetical protein